jgi:hypothetical protein
MNYKAMTKFELSKKIFALGDNPYGMTKAQMVKYLEDADIAQKMSTEQLLAHIRSMQANPSRRR